MDTIPTVGGSGDFSAALGGIVVADFSRVLAGPLATMILADLGAMVIRVESPNGDDTRRWGPPYTDGQSTYFRAVNRNKHAMVLDLASDAGRDVARELVGRADVLVENFRPGVMERFGLGYEHVRALNPRLIYCSVTGFGKWEGASLPGYDFIVQAVGGLMSITGDPDGEPTKVGVALVDVLAGLYALSGILTALHVRSRTDKGQQVEVNLLSALLGSLANQASSCLMAGVVPARMGNKHPSIAPYETLRTSDGMLAVAAGNDRQFRSLCEALGCTALVSDARFSTNPARVQHRDELISALEAALAAQPVDAWVAELHRRGVPAGRINDIHEAISYAESLGLQPVVELRDEESGYISREIANPLRLSSTPASYRFPARRLGADTTEILSWLGVSDDHRSSD